MTERPSESFSEEPLPQPPPAPAETEPEKPAESARQASVAKILELQRSAHKGANWFYWIAGLSIVNSLIMHGGGGIYFVVGLSVTLVVDAIALAVVQHDDL